MDGSDKKMRVVTLLKIGDHIIGKTIKRELSTKRLYIKYIIESNTENCKKF